MDFFFEVIVQFLAELMLQLVSEFLADLGFRAIGAAVKTPGQANPILSIIGSALLGILVAGLTLWLFPHAFLRSPSLRVANLVLLPLLAGLAMSALGAWQVRRGRDRSTLERFTRGAVFAVFFALVRYHWTSVA